jgi:uncharacterized protein YprB with RNaseH-like and TPR domain/predicted nuclease with RNAse H fold/dephospho-CoA kinase
LLKHTFQHLDGFGAIREAQLWQKGIRSWYDFESKKNLQLNSFHSSSNGILNDSIKALAKKDANFFAERLSRSEYYRIVQTFPNETIFVDIETTGLSRYYDKITLIGWGYKNNYDYFIKDSNKKKLFEAFKKAKAVITFNGSFFDLPFIRQEFPDLTLPVCHVDLRFLAYKFGFKGGQKNIENSFGIDRPKEIEDMRGENAPVLWHQYKWGDKQALKKLVLYNKYDINGMKIIFDELMVRILEHSLIPYDKRKVKFFSRSKKINFAQLRKSITKRKFPIYKGEPGPLIHLNKLPKFEKLRIVGIDLSGGEKRFSGWCFLKYSNAITKKIFSNDDLIEETTKYQPDLISIDSPLSLPAGRKIVSDEDPNRNKYGIMRFCEKQLKRRGVNVYPCLINSMQNLTARGIWLATKFRKMGYPVIESFPGAAQDILDIPRKRASEELLKKGLSNFGIKGYYENNEVSHDELDAITSAIVGYFFWCGQFEALGNIEEDYLIIPQLKDETFEWFNHKVLGISGYIAAGKTTAATFISENDFAYGRISQVLAKMLEIEGKPVNRFTLQKLGQKVNRNQGQRWLIYSLLNLLPSSGNFVIDGLRFPEDHAFLKERFGPNFTHIHIETNLELRKKRYKQVKENNIPFTKSLKHPVERFIPKMKDLSDYVIENNDDKNKLYKELQKILNKK